MYLIRSCAAASKASSDAAAPTPAPVAKKRFGIKSVFSKKPGRESDLTKLTAPGAKAPEFAATVAKPRNFDREALESEQVIVWTRNIDDFHAVPD